MTMAGVPTYFLEGKSAVKTTILENFVNVLNIWQELEGDNFNEIYLDLIDSLQDTIDNSATNNPYQPSGLTIIVMELVYSFKDALDTWEYQSGGTPNPLYDLTYAEACGIIDNFTIAYRTGTRGVVVYGS